MKLLTDGDYHNLNEINKSPKKINKKKMSLYFILSLIITTPIAWGLNRVATTIEDANIRDLSTNIKSISTDFQYISSINQSLAQVVEDVKKIEKKVDIDDIDKILIKLNGTLDELIEILKEFPHPENLEKQKEVLKKIEILKSLQIQQQIQQIQSNDKEVK